MNTLISALTLPVALSVALALVSGTVVGCVTVLFLLCAGRVTAGQKKNHKLGLKAN